MDEKIYEQVANEMENNDIRIGLWTKAIANSDGNETRIKSLYIKYRVQSMLDEFQVVKEVIKDISKTDNNDVFSCGH